MDDISEKSHDLTATRLSAQESMEGIQPPRRRVLAIPRARWCRFVMQEARSGVLCFCALGWLSVYETGEDRPINDIASKLPPRLRASSGRDAALRQLAIAEANDLEENREEALALELAKYGIELKIVEQDSVTEYMAAWKEKA